MTSFRTCRLEVLEPRLVCAFTNHIFPMMYSPEGRDNIVSKTIVAPTEPNSRAHIVLTVNGPFGKFLDSKGDIQVPAVPGAVDHDITGGAQARVQIDALSLDAIFSSQSLNLANMKSDVILTTQVELTVTYFGVVRPIEQYRYIFARFISALDRNVATPANPTVLFEHTAVGYTNNHLIMLEGGPNIIFDNPWPSRPFRAVPQSGGIGIIFEPNTITGDFNATFPLDVSVDNTRQPIGTLQLQAHAVTATRTWWLDERELAGHILNSPGYQGNELNALADAQAVTEAVKTSFGMYWNNNATLVATEALADTRIKFPVVAYSPNDPAGGTQLPGLNKAAIATLVAHWNVFNVPTKRYLVSEALKGQTSDRGDTYAIINMARIVSAFPLNGAPFRTSLLFSFLVKAISHELGHTRGFVGHILPKQEADSAATSFDVMQQGFRSNTPPVHQAFLQSNAFLQLAMGKGWNNSVDAAFALMKLTDPTGRYHDIRNVGLPDGVSEVTWQLRRTNPKQVRDVNNDGAVNSHDFRHVVELLNAIGSRALLNRTFDINETFPDVDADGWLTSRDASAVLNYINAGFGTREGESHIGDSAGSVSSVPRLLHNAAVPFDVNDDGNVTMLDVLAVINVLSVPPSGEYFGGESRLYYYDVSGEGNVTTSDALAIINRLNSQANQPAPPARVTMVTEPDTAAMLTEHFHVFDVSIMDTNSFGGDKLHRPRVRCVAADKV